MKQTKIEVQITKNLGNYESVRLGGEWSLDRSDDQQAAYAAAIEQLNAIYAANYLRQPATAEAVKPAPAEATHATPTRQKVSFINNADIVQKLCTRIARDKSVTRDVIDSYYELDEQASNVINLALKIRK